MLALADRFLPRTQTFLNKALRLISRSGLHARLDDRFLTHTQTFLIKALRLISRSGLHARL